MPVATSVVLDQPQNAWMLAIFVHSTSLTYFPRKKSHEFLSSSPCPQHCPGKCAQDIIGHCIPRPFHRPFDPPCRGQSVDYLFCALHAVHANGPTPFHTLNQYQTNLCAGGGPTKKSSFGCTADVDCIGSTVCFTSASGSWFSSSLEEVNSSSWCGCSTLFGYAGADCNSTTAATAFQIFLILASIVWALVLISWSVIGNMAIRRHGGTFKVSNGTLGLITTALVFLFILRCLELSGALDPLTKGSTKDGANQELYLIFTGITMFFITFALLNHGLAWHDALNQHLKTSTAPIPTKVRHWRLVLVVAIYGLLTLVLLCTNLALYIPLATLPVYACIVYLFALGYHRSNLFLVHFAASSKSGTKTSKDSSKEAIHNAMHAITMRIPSMNLRHISSQQRIEVNEDPTHVLDPTSPASKLSPHSALHKTTSLGPHLNHQRQERVELTLKRLSITSLSSSISFMMFVCAQISFSILSISLGQGTFYKDPGPWMRPCSWLNEASVFLILSTLQIVIAQCIPVNLAVQYCFLLPIVVRLTNNNNKPEAQGSKLERLNSKMEMGSFVSAL